MSIKQRADGLLAENRRAGFDYSLQEDLEVGLILTGTEVKSLRRGGSNIAESYVSVDDGELWLINAYIAPLEDGRTFGHDPRQRRKLLASRREIARLWRAVGREGMSIVPLRLYVNERGKMKLKIALAKGKKTQDKRETSAKRDWGRQKARILKNAA